MTTDELKEILERMEKLNPKNKDMLVKKILRDIEEAEWDEVVLSPESLAFQDCVRAKIEEDIATGNVKNYFTSDDLDKLF